MKTHAYVTGSTSTIKLINLPDLEDIYKKYASSLVPLSSSLIPREHLHIGLKYIGHYSDEYTLGLAPRALQRFHDDLCDALEGKVDTFTLAQDRHYTPHMTVAVGKAEYAARIKEIIEQSRNDVPLVLMANTIGMRPTSEKSRAIFQKKC